MGSFVYYNASIVFYHNACWLIPKSDVEDDLNSLVYSDACWSPLAALEGRVNTGLRKIRLVQNERTRSVSQGVRHSKDSCGSHLNYKTRMHLRINLVWQRCSSWQD